MSNVILVSVTRVDSSGIRCMMHTQSGFLLYEVLEVHAEEGEKLPKPGTRGAWGYLKHMHPAMINCTTHLLSVSTDYNTGEIHKN